MSGEAAVRLDGVTKRFGEVTAVRDTSLEVRQGEFLTLLGPSGCGKTTLLNLIAGFLDPDEGEVFIGGERVTDVPTFQRDIGMVFQNYALFPHMNVFENVAFGLRMRKTPGEEIRGRVGEALDIVRLAGYADRRPRELSGGQQQRVALARAIVVKPRVLLLDEPLSALDKNLRSRMQVELKQIQRRIGITTIFVTHDQSEALSLSDRVAIISEGVIQQISGPDEAYRNPRNTFVAEFIGDVNRIDGSVVGMEGGALMVELAGGVRISLSASPGVAFPAGEPVWIFARPDTLRLTDAGTAGAMSGTVQTLVYQGTHVDIYVEVAAIGTIHLRTADYGVMQRWPVGTTVAVALDGGEALVFPRGG
jgi:putative spermidine/putrescine transport system ATP-binding protein/spermidine/putrescine transport system ATP-binding protein